MTCFIEKRLLLGAASLALLAGAVAPVSAATTLVPDDQSSLTVAIANAAAGDTIQITDSATYVTRILPAVPMSIVAAVGQSPTIGCPPDVSSFVEVTATNTTPGTGGLRIGSNAGGRINLDGAPLGGSGMASDYFNFSGTITTGTLVVENVSIYRPQAPNNEIFKAQNDTLDVTFRDVDINLLNITNVALQWQPGCNGTWTFERVTLLGYRVSGIWQRSRNAGLSIVLKNSLFGDLDQDDAQGGARAIRWENTSARGSVTIEDSILRSVAVDSNPTLWIEEGADLNLTMVGSIVYSADGVALMIDDAMTTTSVDINHCDFYSSGATLLVAAPDAEEVNLTLRNSNFISVNDAAATGTLSANDTLVNEKNNFFSFAGTHIGGGFASADFSVDPDYTGPVVAGDATYTEASLLGAGTDSQDIGINGSLIGQVPVELSSFDLM